jgi:hypothetical protein
MKRRNFIVLSTAAFAAGCATPTASNILAVSQAVVTGLSGMITEVNVKFPTLIPAAIQTSIAAKFSLASAALTVLQNSLLASTTASASAVQTVESNVNAVLDALASPPINGLIPAPYEEVIAAVDLQLPLLDYFINAAGATPPTATPAALTLRQQARASAVAVTSTSAPAVLQSYTKTN